MQKEIYLILPFLTEVGASENAAAIHPCLGHFL